MAAKKTTRKGAEEPLFNPTEHEIVPLHEKLSKEDAEQLLTKYSATLRELPKLGVSDPALYGLNAKPGDIIKITRKSRTAGETVFYRGVISE